MTDNNKPIPNAESILQFSFSSQSQHPESIYNSSLPYTFVYEASTDMSVPSDTDINTERFDPVAENQNLAQKEVKTKNSHPSDTNYHSQYYSPRSHIQIRRSYLGKLMDRGFITEKPKRRYRHLFVFDWDDTLLCTTYLNHLKFSQLRQKDHELLQKIDKYVVKILQQCMNRGDVSIITNAAKGWVQYSSEKFLPQTKAFIDRTRITIISARSQYGDEFPNQIKKWKVSAFQKLNSTENNHLITNIICIGDSTIEMQAGQILASSFQKSLLKTVKFRENPRIQELVKQQQLLEKKLDEIVNTAKNLTIKLERKVLVKRKDESNQ